LLHHKLQKFPFLRDNKLIAEVSFARLWPHDCSPPLWVH